MQGQVGYWGGAQGGLAIGFSIEMMRWLEAQNSDRKIVVSVEKNRQVIIMPDRDDGGKVSPAASEKCKLPFRYVSSGRQGSLMVLASALPVFGYMDIEFEAEEGCLVGAISETDHELAWPQLDIDCATYDPAALAKEALLVRMSSLAASGLLSFPAQYRMPMRLRRMLADGAWVDCMSVAKSLAGVN